MTASVQPTDAVVIVDVQNDFCPAGALPVADGDQVVPVLNRLIGRARRARAKVVVTRDWHPADHCSFAARGGPWPAHCVQDSPGAEYRPDLDVPGDAIRVDKGTDPHREAYSGFDGTGLAGRLKREGVRRLWVGGLALDVCVKATVLDAIREGFEVHVLVPATRAVGVRPGDGRRAIEQMETAGAVIEETEP